MGIAVAWSNLLAVRNKAFAAAYMLLYILPAIETALVENFWVIQMVLSPVTHKCETHPVHTLVVCCVLTTCVLLPREGENNSIRNVQEQDSEKLKASQVVVKSRGDHMTRHLKVRTGCFGGFWMAWSSGRRWW